MTTHYQEGVVPYSREELLEQVASQMSEKRFNHVKRVEKMAIKLAEIYGESIEKASIAALTHDYGKERSDEEYRRKIMTEGHDASLLTYGNEIWHGLLGADFVRDELGINDDDILEAIRTHTTGAADMSRLGKIIYVADYVEEGRTFPGVEDCRTLAFKDLDQAVAYETKHTLLYLIENEKMIYPKTLETYNRWVVQSL
ncbi:bis(5'-nucleosyl)-tetraphosphatase (symmetrical) YqeK [Vagococcus lutrae]|uniref:bis(5'-nucleosyl)-tetraphosphatase (symmetrical) YqeK n=1 Tax=Vagococcus lutrae TaxID=81947 RepID=UPI00200F4CC5|nr:bis(5'-nucleosyl)-tetraphosphatase (symmetrical) YqeK [Vagococcus lutrae]UQF12325.1 bis(5'-nucleosyl)-tetraphosphatase (symmetrical) YqeK [Vagococcus lutrae]